MSAAEAIARYIDHTLLRPETTAAEIDRLCDEALAYRFAAVCVTPVWVARCVARLGGAAPVAAVIAFPLGATPPEVKAAEAARAVADGATELDVVGALGHIRAGDWHYVRNDLMVVMEAVPATPVKVILETALLNDRDLERACRVALEAGAQAVKTSTGTHPAGGATVEAVALMRATVGPGVGVKASGGIRDCATALRMLAAGASRLGTSSGVAIASCLGDAPVSGNLAALAAQHAPSCRTGRPGRTSAGEGAGVGSPRP